MTRPLEDRVALITGASAGIGEACAFAFARAGAKMILNARRAYVLGKVESAIDSEMGVETAHCVPGDCADTTTIKIMLQAAADHFDRPADLVVVNAGRGLAGSVTTSDPEQWEALLRTNILGAAKLMRAAAAEMTYAVEQDDWQTRPRDIVVLGSTVGSNISPFSSMYGSTKFAVGSLAEALRREIGPRGVRVSLICPGIVKSEFQEVAEYDPVTFGRFMDSVGPVLVPEDIARVVGFIVGQPANVHVNDVVIRPTRQEYP